jgi:peptidoglycan LD-endopeptidase LytH
MTSPLRSISKSKIVIVGLFIIISIGLIIPQQFVNPVIGADQLSYNSKSFWFYPWGRSGTHKGIDIFAKEGTIVQSSTSGLVLFTGEINTGGKVVLILGPKWRLHYYAHLQEINTQTFAWTSIKEGIGKVGTTGNAKGKPSHLHYSIVTLIPYFWKADSQPQGWKKMFYLNPIDYLN